MPKGPSGTAAVYERTVRASLERVWENVLDWEHLPWLHASTFSSIRPLRFSDEGWRAVVGQRSARGERESTIEVTLDRPGLRYRTSTVAGAGVGSEILTMLHPVEKERTAIRVEFRFPSIDVERGAALGRAVREVYARLWDEDEAMMLRRQEVLDRAPDGRPYRLVSLGDRRIAHSTVCPHRGGPLLGADVEDACVRCPWHGYRFALVDGRCRDDARLRLAIEDAGELPARDAGAPS